MDPGRTLCREDCLKVLILYDGCAVFEMAT